MHTFGWKLWASFRKTKGWCRVKQHGSFTARAKGYWLLVNKEHDLVLEDFAERGVQFRVVHPTEWYLGYWAQRAARKLNRRLIKNNDVNMSAFLCEYMDSPSQFTSMRVPPEDQFEVIHWLEETGLEGKYYIDVMETGLEVWFSYKDDAALFKLTWFKGDNE